MNQPEINLYHYRARLVSVYDGDTMRVDLDLGMGIWRNNIALRLFGIDTPELRGDDREAGLRARDAVRDAVGDGASVIIQTHRDATGKYGRLLATVWIPEEPHGYFNLNKWLLEVDLAVPYE